MKEIFDWMREQMLIRKSAWEEESVADKVSAEKHIGTWNVALRILGKAEAKWKEDCCEWKWGIDYAQVQCRGDKILFESRRLFTYCPYCGKLIAEVE